MIALGAVAAVSLSLLAASPAAAESPAQIAAAAAPGVVSIESTFSADSTRGSNREVVGSGSGFVLDRAGRILTSEHVIEDATKIHVSFADGTKVHATVVSKDPLLDLAVLRVKVGAATLHPLVLGFAESLRPAIRSSPSATRSASTGA